MMMRLTIMMWMLTRPMNGVTGRIEHLSFQVTSGFGKHGPTLLNKRAAFAYGWYCFIK